MADVRVLSVSELHSAGAMNHMKSLTRLFLLVLSLTSVAGQIARADDDDDRDHEIARKALSEGRIRPLTQIIDELKAQFPGQIVGVELKTKKANIFIYEFKVLAPDGKLKEVKVDATTAKIVKIEDDD